MLEIILIAAGILAIILIWCSIAFYKVVPPTEAHVVASGHSKWVVSSDDSLATAHKRSYFAIPLLRQVRKLDLTIKELESVHETYEQNQARFRVTASLKYRINNPLLAAETYTDAQNLNKLLEPIIQSGVRDVTIKYDINTIRSNKQKMEDEMKEKIGSDLAAWGCILINFQLVDFQDTNESKVISNISRRREVEIESMTRQVNAEKLKQASMTESENTELSETRKIQMTEAIAKREQDKAKTVAEQQKLAKEKEYDVIRTQTIRQTEIDKEKAIIQAEQSKATETIIKDRKQLEGQGDRLRAEEQAMAEAAPIRQKLFAEAEGKLKLQEALSKFGDDAIRALVAEKIVAMQQTVGVANAQALSQAKISAFMGSGDKGAFDFGQLMTSLGNSNELAAKAVLNRLAKPNDLGIREITLGGTPTIKK